MPNIVHVEVIDSATLAEYMNDADASLEFVTTLRGTNFDADDQTASAESDHPAVGDSTSGEQRTPDVVEAIRNCIENQGEDSLFEFVIPLNQKEDKYVYIRIGVEQ